MNACYLCGNNRSLRFDHGAAEWRCYAGCGSTRRTAPSKKRPRSRPPLFNGFWADPLTGHRLGRATRAELAEAWRLWAVHRDIREGRER